jgi:hypothetical protein
MVGEDLLMDKKFLLFMMVAMLFIVPTVSAYDFDNVKSYDVINKEVTISNSVLGIPFLPLGEIAKVKLISDLDVQVGTGYQKVAEFQIDSKTDYSEAIKSFELYNARDGKTIQRQIDLKYKTYENVEIKDYKQVCTETINKNATKSQNCENVVSGSHFENKEIWKDLSSLDMKAEILTIGLFTDVQAGDHVEWIPNLFGVRVQEWATWTASLNVGLINYYAFEEASGNFKDGVAGNNLTIVGAVNRVTGKIGNAVELDGSTSNYLLSLSNSGIVGTIDRTICLWAEADTQLVGVYTSMGTATNYHKFVTFQEPYQSRGYQVSLFSGDVYSGTHAITTSYSFHCIIKNSTSITWYQDGSLLWNSANTLADTGADKLTVGYDISTYNNAYDGEIDELGIWNRSLSSTEITQLYNGGTGLTYTNNFGSNPPNITMNTVSANYTDPLTKTINVTAWDDQKVQNVSVYVNGVINQTNTSGLNNSFYLFDIPLSDGTWNIYGKATDNESQSTSSTNVTFFIDSIHPVVTANLTNSTLYVLGGNLTLNYNVTHSPDLTGVSAWFMYNGINTSLNVSQSSRNFTTVAGQYDLVVYANDSIGNLATPIALSFTLDAIAPHFTLVSLNNVSTISLPVNATINVTTTDTNLASCKYSTSDVGANVTYTCNTSQDISFATGGSKTITVYANDTAGNYNQTTYSFNIYDFVVLQGGQTVGSDGIAQTFTLVVNSTSFPIGDADASLWYNGINYAYSTKTVNSANAITFTKVLVVPNGTGNSTGKPVNWLWNYEADHLTNRNSSTQTQTVYSVSITDCAVTSGTVILNMSLKDEELNSLVNVTAPNNAKIEIDLTISSPDNSSLSWDFAKEWDDTQTVAVCVPNGLLNASDYRIDFIVGYDNTLHVREFFYMENGTLDNSTEFNSYTLKSIDLMDLASADSTTFLFTYTDADNQEVDDIIVHTFRKYIGEGVFREVERSKQDNAGQTHVHLVEEDVIYYFMITQGGTILFTSDTYNAKCLATPCEITLSASATETNWSIIDNEGGLYTTTSNRSTRVVTTSFNIESSDLVNVSLYKLTNGTATLINTSSLTATAGSIDLDVPLAYGNSTFFVSIYRNNEFVKSEWVDLQENGRDYFGTFGALLGGIIVLALILMSVTEGAGMIIFTALALVIIGVMQLVDLGWMALISIICAGGIIVWKLVSRRNR